MRSRPRQPAVEPEVLRAALARPLTPRDAAVCSCELVKTLLFLRAQLPALFSEMQDALQDACAPDTEGAAAAAGAASLPGGPLRRKRLSSAERRAQKTVFSVAALEAVLTPAVFEDAALEARSGCPR